MGLTATLKNIYKKLIPTKTAEYIAISIANTKGKIILLFSFLFPKNVYYDAWRYVGVHKHSMYPFAKSIDYNNLSIEVFFDDDKKLPYVIHQKKRLYFPDNLSEQRIIKKYKTLLIEQDQNSAHRYLKSYDEIKGKTLLDIGAAEGIFALEAIDYVDNVFLFEYEDEWIKPLNATFEKWKDKVEIVQKYVGDKDEDIYITIDSFLRAKNMFDNICIKMDIEGAEVSALQGASELLKNGKSVQFYVCTYHYAIDEKKIGFIFDSYNYSRELSDGYLLISFYLRKGICRAVSKN